MRRSFWFVLVFFLVSSSVRADDRGIAEKALDALKAATVYVKVEGNKGTATGSGFLIHVDGDTGWIVTNRHVVAASRGRLTTPQRYSLVFRSGSSKEQVVPGEVVAEDSEQDLAVLKVTSKELPTPLDMAQPAKPRETMTIYTFGFPLGDALARNARNPAVTIGKGTISSLREDGRGKLQRVQLDGELNPGNSGGPVVDVEGHLVGIAVSKMVGTKIGFAIPAAELIEMLNGRVAAVVPRSLRVDDSSAEVELEVPLIDPLHRLQSVELRHVRKDTLKQVPQSDAAGNWPDLAESVKVPVKIEGGKAVAKAKVIAPAKKAQDWLFQAAYTNRAGKSTATQPVSLSINFATPGVVRLDGRSRHLWETITSKEGGFTVDMPIKPTLNISRTQGTRNGSSKYLLLGSHTDDGVYLAFRIDMPTAIPGNMINRILDAQRDRFAEEWNGKVIREKRVTAQGQLGRDFTIVGKPDEDGVCTIRMREYLVGRSIFAVAVISPPEADLPEDSGHFLGSLALGESKVRASGTPEPEPTGTELADWGLAIDPDKDCKFKPGPRSMTIEIPAVWHDMGGALHRFNAPRVLREVDGDFVLTVKVGGEFKPGAKSMNPKSFPYISGGILLWSDSDNFIRLERGAINRGPRIHTIAGFEEWEGGYSGANHNEAIKPGDCYLGLERKGSRIFGAISNDGKNWKRLKPIDTVWPSKLKVGLMAISTSNEPFTVKFEKFDLKTK